jgi:hypothetical protein
MTLAETNIRQAEQAGAAEYSALELDRARQKLNQARTALQNDDNENAFRLAEQSAADAELAAAQARAGQSEAAVANAVRDALLERGVAFDRIHTRGLGEDSLVASNDTAAGRQQNRRVEVVISDENGQFAR